MMSTGTGQLGPIPWCGDADDDDACMHSYHYRTITIQWRCNPSVSLNLLNLLGPTTTTRLSALDIVCQLSRLPWLHLTVVSRGTLVSPLVYKKDKF